jgi:hypothetical protein
MVSSFLKPISDSFTGLKVPVASMDSVRVVFLRVAVNKQSLHFPPDTVLKKYPAAASTIRIPGL